MDGLDAELARVAAVLLEDRVLRRVIKQHRRLPGIGLQVPHARCYTLPRADLADLVERDELHVDPQALPAHVAMFSGSRAALAAGDPGELSRAWRLIFHARVHQAFDERLAAGAISPASIRERIHRIGQTEFDEIRSVLRQEDLLLPPVDDTRTYVEFVALYLELQAFAPQTLDRTFPTLELARVDAAIALDLAGAVLLAATRPAGAPEQPMVEPAAPPARAPGEPTAMVDASARTRASRARLKGNRARAAILALRAGDRGVARQDLDELGARLARAVGAAVPDPGWTDALLPVAALAAAERVLRFTPSARLLHDLQAACVVAEREIKIVDAVGWALSLGQRPIVRALPATREVRVAKHLHAAAKKVAACTLASPGEQARLAAAVRDLILRADAHVRIVMRPKIEAALKRVALHPGNLPERVAEKKLVDELLDQAVAVGRLSIGNLRDAISHNDLKMPDLAPGRLLTGDELLRADHALSRSLDGVYRRGEGYLRYLQKLSSVFFGTRIGRLLTLYLILPLLGSYTVFKGAQEMIDLVAKHTHRAAREIVALSSVNPDPESVLRWLEAVVGQAHHAVPAIATPTSIGAGAVFLFLLLHAPVFRRAVVFVLRLAGRGLRLVLFDAPLALLGRPLVRRLLGSRFARWVIKPAVPATAALVIGHGGLRWPVAAGVFVFLALGLNSRTGRDAQDVAADGLVRSGRHLSSRIVPSVIRWILEIFAELMELLDRGLYRVDEWLRFKAGQSWLTLVVKGVLGTVWSAVAYFLRLYINLFIEPGVNPIKHFPVVTVAAKLMVPLYPTLLSAISGPSRQLMGPALGTSFAAFTVFVMPGVAGFLVWELKENWKLYRQTRSKTLPEVAIGHHGETMVGFLKPGFHSGTIPKRFTKLRRAAWKADERGVAKHRDELHHLEEAVRKFAERELVSILDEAAAFRAAGVAGVAGVAIRHVALGSNRVQIELACPSVSPVPARIAIEQQSGWTVAGIPERGWIDQLGEDQRRILEIALAGFYKRAGVDLVREQLEYAVAGDEPPPPYDISDEGLVVWPGRGYQTEAVYDLRAPSTPRLRGAPWSGELPSLADRHALYFREALGWAVWTGVWEQLARGEEPTPIALGPRLIRRPLPRATALAG
jgi:hypothetical protein